MVKLEHALDCDHRVHCRACRTDANFRQSLVKAGIAKERDFACPFGVELKPGLGDLVETMVKPIAKALKLDCLDDQSRLKPESPCAKKRDRLNAAGRKLGL